MIVRLFFLAAAALLFAAPAFADSTMLVIDSSASMAGKLGRDRKADLVADSLKEALASVPMDAKLGLVAFGAGSKTSCTDAAVLVEPRAHAADAVIAAAADLQPRGRAPLAAALERAADAADYRHEPMRMIVIVDEIEPCDADPCVKADALKHEAQHLSISVIGLGLSDADAASASCIAAKGGGRFLNAKDGTDLAGGLTATLAPVKEPSTSLPAASIDAPDHVVQSDVFAVGYDGPKEVGDRIQISWPGLPAGAEIRSVLVSPDGQKRMMTAPAEAGSYEIRYFDAKLNAVLATRVIDVALRPVSVSAPARIQAGAPMTINWTGPAARFDEIWITRAGEDARLDGVAVKRKANVVIIDAPLEPGAYEVRYHSAVDSATAAKVRFTVDRPSVTLAAPPEARAGARIDVGWTGPGGRYDDVVIAKSGMAAGEHVTVARLRPDLASVRITVPSEPGSYVLRYVAGGGRAVFAEVPLEVR